MRTVSKRGTMRGGTAARISFCGVFCFVCACLLSVKVAWASEIHDAGKPRDDSENDRDPLEASLDGTQLGLVTWAEARVDVPIGSSIALLPQAALLHIAPDPHSHVSEEWHPFVGAGASWDPSEGWHLELSGIYGPPADDIESYWAEMEVERDFGGNDKTGAPPTLELDGTATVKYVRWEDGRGPAGSDIVQAFLDLEPVWRPTSRLEIRPMAMLFAYDKPLDQAVGNRLGSISVLARVGTYAPLVLVGAGLGYSFLRWLTPAVTLQEIVYAASVGDATQATAGARVHVSKSLTVSADGGWLWNRVQGPLVPPQASESMPVAHLEVSATF